MKGDYLVSAGMDKVRWLPSFYERDFLHITQALVAWDWRTGRKIVRFGQVRLTSFFAKISSGQSRSKQISASASLYSTRETSVSILLSSCAAESFSSHRLVAVQVDGIVRTFECAALSCACNFKLNKCSAYRHA